MRSRSIPIRLIALIVLLTAACDYAEFDRVDLTAPMSSAGLEGLPAPVQPTLTPVRLNTTNLPDDRCLFCSPWIEPQLPALFRVSLASRLTQSAKISLPSIDLALIERPPRA